MKKCNTGLLKCLSLFAVLCFGMAYSAKADTFSSTVTVYYVDNPTDTGAASFNAWGLTNSGGDSAVTGTTPLAITSAGDVENVSLSTSNTEGVAVGTITGTDFTLELYNPPSSAPGPTVTGTTLNAGAYVYDSCLDYFGAKTASGTTGDGTGCPNAYGYGACMTGQICNAGSSPNDVVTINVAANGVVTIASSSLEIAFAPTPELSSLVLFGTGLLAMGFVLRKRSGLVV